MKRARTVIGLLILFGIAYYLYAMWRQTTEIQELCALYSLGTKVESIRDRGLDFGVQVMGPFKVREQPGAQSYVFCAPLTMCDVSCAVKIKDRLVISSDYSSR